MLNISAANSQSQQFFSYPFKLRGFRLLLCLMCYCIFYFIIIPKAQAQSVRGWIGGGLGGSVASNGVGLSGRTSVQVVIKEITVAGRLTANSGGSSGVDGLFGSLRDEYFDGGLIIGYAPRSEGKGQLIVGGGPSYMWGRRIIGREKSPCGWFGCGVEWEQIDPIFGIAVEAGYYGSFSGAFGISIILHSNVNSKQFFLGGTLGLTVGKLR